MWLVASPNTCLCYPQAPTLLAGCSQVQKSELIVGVRMGADSWELDELEVIMQCTSLIKLRFAWSLVQGSSRITYLHALTIVFNILFVSVMSTHLWHLKHLLNVSG